MKFRTFTVNLTVKKKIYTKYSPLWWCIIQLNLVAKRSAVQQVRPKQSYLIKWALTVTLNLKTADQSSCVNFGPWRCITIPSLFTEGLSSWGGITSFRWTFTGILNLSCDLDHNRAIQSFYKTTHLMMMCHQTQLCSKRISSLDTIFKKKKKFNWDRDLEDSKRIFLK